MAWRRAASTGGAVATTHASAASAATQRDVQDVIATHHVGDTVDVHTRIVEGDKERIQIFEGIVIGLHRGGARATLNRK